MAVEKDIRIDVNFIRPILKRCYSSNTNTGMFAGDVARSIGYPDPACHTSGIDDPATITVLGNDILLEHLCDGILTTQPDAFRVDLDRAVEDLLIRLVHALGAAGLRLLKRDPGIVDHAITLSDCPRMTLKRQ